MFLVRLKYPRSMVDWPNSTRQSCNSRCKSYVINMRRRCGRIARRSNCCTRIRSKTWLPMPSVTATRPAQPSRNWDRHDPESIRLSKGSTSSRLQLMLWTRESGMFFFSFLLFSFFYRFFFHSPTHPLPLPSSPRYNRSPLFRLLLLAEISIKKIKKNKIKWEINKKKKKKSKRNATLLFLFQGFGKPAGERTHTLYGKYSRLWGGIGSNERWNGPTIARISRFNGYQGRPRLGDCCIS